MSSSPLPKRRLGKTGLMVTIVGFGGIPIQRISEEEALATIRRAYDLGVNFFDTARGYTNSEERIGKALEGREFYVATKSGARDANEIYEDVCRSLRSLRRNRIDLFQFHGVSSDEDLKRVLAPGGALAGLQRAREEGKIAHIGLTGHRRETLVRALELSDQFETVQVPLNIVEDDAAGALAAECARRDVGFIAMKPAGGGNFTNPALSVKWCLNQPITVAIPGMGSVAEAEEDVALGRGEIALTAAELAECERMKAELGQRTCRRCGYCEPCPNGVQIFLVLNGRAIMSRMGVQRYLEWGAKQAIVGVSDCQECGICITKCPYGLPIPELLREMTGYYETLPELR